MASLIVPLLASDVECFTIRECRAALDTLVPGRVRVGDASLYRRVASWRTWVLENLANTDAASMRAKEDASIVRDKLATSVKRDSAASTLRKRELKEYECGRVVQTAAAQEAMFRLLRVGNLVEVRFETLVFVRDKKEKHDLNAVFSVLGYARAMVVSAPVSNSHVEVRLVDKVCVFTHRLVSNETFMLKINKFSSPSCGCDFARTCLYAHQLPESEHIVLDLDHVLNPMAASVAQAEIKYVPATHAQIVALRSAVESSAQKARAAPTAELPSAKRAHTDASL